MMSLKDQLLEIAHLYATAVGTKGRDGQMTLKGISSRIFGDGKTFARIAAGGDVTTGNFEKAMRWFSQNWPDVAEWPENIERPLVEAASPEAA